MKFKGIAILAVACLALGMLSIDASAAGRNPGSLLLYPNYNTGENSIAVLTITNTGDMDLAVRLVWIDHKDCTPEDQWIELTAGDTFTFLDEAMNPEKKEEGFMYAYVVESVGSTHEVDADYLIGQEFIFQVWPGAVSYGINAVAFNALTLTPDGKLHLDGVEYDAAPSTVYFPRFFGQDDNFKSKVIFINLTGGQWFEQQANVLVYNDNEQAFSSTVYFPCWDEMCLKNVSGATTETHLLSSNHDPLELWDGNANPLVPHKKTGWIEFTGDWAWNPQTSFYIQNPSLYAVLVESVMGMSAADLPWQVEDPAVFKNASLWPTGPWGN